MQRQQRKKIELNIVFKEYKEWSYNDERNMFVNEKGGGFHGDEES